MKQITKIEVPVKPTYKLSSEPNKHKFYGVSANCSLNGGDRGFITRADYYDGKFIVVSSNGCTFGNGWVSLSGNTLSDVVSVSIDGGFYLYEFDTYQDLFLWLAAR